MNLFAQCDRPGADGAGLAGNFLVGFHQLRQGFAGSTTR